jgi:glycosyltransferase involved in cell wall biosynthesis
VNNGNVDVSVVMPCLNEEEAIGQCIQTAMQAFEDSELDGEVVVADNGSTDRSVKIATTLGARVVHQPERGYGNAYLKGFSEARGRYIVMGDSDGTYDFSEVSRFIAPLEDGYDFVMGSRLKGDVLPGAMPWLHHHIGVPVLTGLLNFISGTRVTDAHCGMRAFTKDAMERMKLRTTGMEFASEMVINAARAGLNITEVPITYYPREGSSKLNTFRDGYRHLRFMLMYSPTYLFLVPGLSMLLLGLILLVALLGGPLKIGDNFIGLQFMVLGSLLAILGYQVINLGFYAKIYALEQGLTENDAFVERLLRHFNLERGLIFGSLLLLIGLVVYAFIVRDWLDTAAVFNVTMELRRALLGMTMMILGVQTIFSSFFLSILGIKKQ